MVPYTPQNPVFSGSLQTYETTDPAEATLLNTPLKQLIENDLVIKEAADNAKVYKDDTTEDVFRMGIDNGLLYIEEVEEEDEGEE